MTPYLILTAVAALIAAPAVIVMYGAAAFNRICEGDPPTSP